MIEEEADEDIKQLGGVKSDEEISDTVFYILRSRFPWLFVNMCTALIAACVIRLFEGSLEQMVALAILMPIVASMGGNAGTQTMTVTVRALATRSSDAPTPGASSAARRWSACSTAWFSPSSWAHLAGLWFQSPELGLVIGLALVTSCSSRRSAASSCRSPSTGSASIPPSRRAPSSPASRNRGILRLSGDRDGLVYL